MAEPPSADRTVSHPLPPVPVPDRAQLGVSLPTSLTPLIGREAEVASLRSLLNADEVRLLTLTGPGGIGKTRLVIEVATHLRDAYAHGACFVGLASIRDAALVPVTVARAFGVRESGDRPAAEILEALLQNRHLLLVLDNLEQAVGAGPWLAHLLAACPRLTALVTSRVPLRVGGEERYVVPPLSLPDTYGAGAKGLLLDSAAVTLFVQRARAVQSDFALTANNAAMIAAICRSLDGLPLAIELAAARSNVLDPATLLTRLEQRLPLLTGGARDAPTRLQTMRNAIAWSYDLLSREEQALFCQLSVFAGGFTLAAAVEVGSILGDSSCVLDLLTALVNSSLVRSLAPPDGARRFTMFETIREYGLEQLAAAGEEDAARDAHAAYYARLAEEAEGWLKRTEQVAWLDHLETEHDNLRAALEWLPARGAIEQALSLAGSLRLFWWLREHRTEGYRRCEALLARPDAQARTIGRATALVSAGMLAHSQGDRELAVARLDEALGIFRELRDREGIALALLNSFFPLSWLGKHDRAYQCITECLALYRELGDAWGIAGAYLRLGTCADRGEAAGEKPPLEMSLTIAREVGDRWTAAMALLNQAEAIDRLTGDEIDLAGIEARLEESLGLLRELGCKGSMPYAILNLGYLRQRQGDIGRATELCEHGLILARESGNKEMIAAALVELGSIDYRIGDRRRAVHRFRESLTIFQEMRSTLWMADTLDRLAFVAGGMRAELAARLLGAADQLREGHPMVRSEYERVAYEREVAKIRDALGEAALAAAWDAGRALSMEGVMAEVAVLETAIVHESRPTASESSTLTTHGLTPRELEVVRLVAAGLSNREIANALFISPSTAITHVRNLLAKLGLESRTAVAAWAIRHGLD